MAGIAARGWSRALRAVSRRSLRIKATQQVEAHDVARPRPSVGFTLRVLTDRECPFCEREIGYIKQRDASDRVEIVDISDPNYSPEENGGVTYAEAMRRIHAVDEDGEILSGVDALRRMYEEVGLGWVYAVAKWGPAKAVLEGAYEVWARFRLPMSGRGSLEEVIANAQEQIESEGASCRIDGSNC